MLREEDRSETGGLRHHRWHPYHGRKRERGCGTDERGHQTVLGAILSEELKL